MGLLRISPVNAMIGWLRKIPMKLKVFLGVLLAVCVLVAIKLTIENRYIFFKYTERIYIIGIVVLIYKLCVHKTCSGLSLKSQELTAIFLITRLGCSMFIDAKINMHTVFDSAYLLATLGVISVMRFKLKKSYIKDFDTVHLLYLVVPCAILAIIFHPHMLKSFALKFFWAFSIYLESVSIFPQLRYMQNAKVVETFTGYYVFSLGISRFFSLGHWILQIYDTRGSYLFVFGNGYFWFTMAFFAEMVQSFILADFCYYYVKSFIQGQLLTNMPV